MEEQDGRQHQQQRQNPHPHPHHHSHYASAWDDDDADAAGVAARGHHPDDPDDDIGVEVEVEPEPIMHHDGVGVGVNVGVGDGEEGDPYSGALIYSPQPSPSPPPPVDVDVGDDNDIDVDMERRRRLVQQVTAMAAAQEAALRYQREGGGRGDGVYQGNGDEEEGGGGAGPPQDAPVVGYDHHHGSAGSDAYGDPRGVVAEDAVAAYQRQQRQQQQQYDHYGVDEGMGGEQQQSYGYEERERQPQQHDPTSSYDEQDPTPAAVTQTETTAVPPEDEGRLHQYRQEQLPQAYDRGDSATLDRDGEAGGGGGGIGDGVDGRDQQLYQQQLGQAGYHHDDMAAATSSGRHETDISGGAASASYEQPPVENEATAAASIGEVEGGDAFLRLQQQQRYPHLQQDGVGDVGAGSGGGGGEEEITAATATPSNFPPGPGREDEPPVTSPSAAATPATSHQRRQEEEEAASMNSMSDADVRAVATVATMAALRGGPAEPQQPREQERPPCEVMTGMIPGEEGEGPAVAPSVATTTSRPPDEREIAADPQAAMQVQEELLTQQEQEQQRYAQENSSIPTAPQSQPQLEQQPRQEEEKVAKDEQPRLAEGPYLGSSGERLEPQYKRGLGGAEAGVGAGEEETTTRPLDGGVRDEAEERRSAQAPPPSSSSAAEFGCSSSVAAAVAAAAASAGVVVEGEGEDETGVAVDGVSRAASAGADASSSTGGDGGAAVDGGETPVPRMAAADDVAGVATGRDGVVRGLGGEEDERPPPGGVEGAVVDNLPSPEQQPWQAHDPTAGDVDFVTAAAMSPPMRKVASSGGGGVTYSPQEALRRLGAGTRIPADGMLHDRKIAYVEEVGPDIVQCQTVTARGKPCANVAAAELTYDGMGDRPGGGKMLYCHLHTLHQLNKDRDAAGGWGGLRSVRFLFEGGWGGSSGIPGGGGGGGGVGGVADGGKVRRRTKKTASRPPEPHRHRSVLESDNEEQWNDSLLTKDNLVTYRVDLTRPLGATFTAFDEGGGDVGGGGKKSFSDSSVYDEVRVSMKMESGMATNTSKVAQTNGGSGIGENQQRPAMAPVSGAAAAAADVAEGGRGRPGGADVSMDEMRAAPQDRHRGPDGSDSVGEPCVFSNVENPPPPPCLSGVASADRAEEKGNSVMPDRTSPNAVEANADTGKESVNATSTTADTGAELVVVGSNEALNGDTVGGASGRPIDGTADKDKGKRGSAAEDAGLKNEGATNSKLDRWKIREVHPQSQAFQLGMSAGQVVARVNSTDVTTKDDLPLMIEWAMQECMKRRQNGVDSGDGDNSGDALDLVVFRRYPPASDKVLHAGRFACRNGERKYTKLKRKRRAFARNWDPWKAFPRKAGGGIRRISVVPSGRINGDTGIADTLAVSSVSWDDMRIKIEARVQRICDDFCLLRAIDDGGLIHFKDVSNLVFASLVHESPLPLPMTTPTTETETSWFTDSKDKIVGPQPWVATRQFVLQNVYNMLEGEDQLDWLSSRGRRVVLGEKYTPIIEEYLKIWRPCLAESVWKDTLRLYAEKLWTRFSIDHLDMRNRDANINMRARRSSAVRKLTWRWVEDEAERLASSGVCPSVPSNSTSNGSNGGFSSMSGSDDAAALEKKVLACLHEIRYDTIPFARDLRQVARTALHKFRAAHVNLKTDHISAQSVRDVLDDLEDESDYLSQQNDVLKVRFKWSSIRPYTGVHRAAMYDILSTHSPSQRSQSSDEWEEGDAAAYKSPVKNKKRAKLSPSTPASAAADGDGGQLCNTLEVGDRVYAEFTNGSYYWGNINDITFTKTKEPRYSVRFDDGDMLNGLHGDKMCTEAEFVESFGTQPPPPPNAASASTKRKKKRGRPVGSSVNMLSGLSKVLEVSPTVAVPDYGRPLTLSELQKYRCKTCELCRRRDCEHCYSCRRNKSGDSNADDEVCLQKMCCNIEEKYKAQPADLGGFPSGWTFLFHAPRKSNFRSVGHQHEALNGLKIISPNGRLYRSIESAATCKVVDSDIINRKFFEHVGVVLVEKGDKDHSLIGKKYKAEWTDVNGFHKVIFGQIVSCSEDWRDGEKHESFNVHYTEESRAVIRQFSSTGSVGGLEVIPTQTLSSELAWGGCILSERALPPKNVQDSGSLSTVGEAKPYKCWVVPDMRKEELVGNSLGKSFPRLTLIFRGCKLVFSVKESSIPNAGYGVFVKSIPLESDYREHEDDPIRLRPGELLDIGVYAPFRQEDIKHESVFKLKNYIHSMACEEWCFDATKEDHQYDITDEVTGKAHALAQKHIPMYVNECKMNETPTIYAEHDPEGSVHYLFGIEYTGDSEKYEKGIRKFRRKLLDGEQEVFVNYGLEYEKVRVRKGYSAQPKSEKSQVMEKIENDDVEYIKEIDAFDTESLAMCMRYFEESFLNASRGEKMEQLSSNVKARALGVLKRIQTRLICLEDENKDDIENGGVVSDEVNAHGKELSDLLHFSDDLIERTKVLSCR